MPIPIPTATPIRQCHHQCQYQCQLQHQYTNANVRRETFRGHALVIRSKGSAASTTLYIVDLSLYLFLYLLFFRSWVVYYIVLYYIILYYSRVEYSRVCQCQCQC
jgi:hypothetical protein